MKRCIAYKPLGNSRNAWVDCKKRPAPGSRLCRNHEDAVNGVVLGLLVSEGNAHTKRVRMGSGQAKQIPAASTS